MFGKAKQDLDFLRMDVEIEVATEGNPEFKIINIAGKESSFSVETFGRPKPNGIIIDPHNYILEIEPEAARALELLPAEAQTLSSKAATMTPCSSISALSIWIAPMPWRIRMGEASSISAITPLPRSLFWMPDAAAVDLTTRWTEVWSHIYLGRIYDIQGDRTRTVNEYSKAKQTADDTGGAQAEAEKSLKKAYEETGA